MSKIQSQVASVAVAAAAAAAKQVAVESKTTETAVGASPQSSFEEGASPIAQFEPQPTVEGGETFRVPNTMYAGPKGEVICGEPPPTKSAPLFERLLRGQREAERNAESKPGPDAMTMRFPSDSDDVAGPTTPRVGIDPRPDFLNPKGPGRGVPRSMGEADPSIAPAPSIVPGRPPRRTSDDSIGAAKPGQPDAVTMRFPSDSDDVAGPTSPSDRSRMLAAIAAANQNKKG